MKNSRCHSTNCVGARPSQKGPKFGKGFKYAFGETIDPDEPINNDLEYLVLVGPPQDQRAQIPNYDAYAGQSSPIASWQASTSCTRRCARTLTLQRGRSMLSALGNCSST